MYIDSHCHLTFKDVDTQAVLVRARAAGVEGLLAICTHIGREAQGLCDLAKDNADIWYTVGTHPHEGEEDISLDALVALAKSDPKIVGLGETGLDYYYDRAPRAMQKSSFIKHIRASLACDLPLVIHCRAAEEDVMRILREEGGGKSTGVMHCFSGTPWLAAQALALGLYISFSGILTFKTAQALREIAASVPLERLLIETDAPYLAPHPYRGTPNEPAFIVHTAHCLAEIKDVSVEVLASATKENFFRLFAKSRT